MTKGKLMYRGGPSQHLFFCAIMVGPGLLLPTGFSLPQHGVKLAGPGNACEFQNSPLVTSVLLHIFTNLGRNLALMYQSGMEIIGWKRGIQKFSPDLIGLDWIGCLIGSSFTCFVCSLGHDTELGMTKTVVMRMQGRLENV